MTSLSWNSFLLELERRDIDPPITEIIDNYTDEIREEIILDYHKKRKSA